MRDITELQNGYRFINGVEYHAELGERFQIPHFTIKRHVGIGHHVEVRIDSPRFSGHADAPELCECEHCREPTTKPVLCHEEPASFVEIPVQPVPSRGWGEQFWIQVTGRAQQLLTGVIDNHMYEAKLHGLRQGDEIWFHEDHILAVHPIDTKDIMLDMNDGELREFTAWLKSKR
jgi:hypothetical protein